MTRILIATSLLLCALASPARADDPTTDLQSIPWGISASASSAKDFRDWFPKMSQAGIRQIRLFPEWRSLQSADGKWNFDRSDALVKAAKDNNMYISGLLFGAAPGTKDGGHAFPMKQLDAWGVYTATLVEHYKDSIHDWEVWNEGNAAFNDGHHTTADYAALVAAAYESAKKTSPKARIGMSVASFDAAYLNQAILAQAKLGKPDHFDYLCIHPYETLELLKNPDGEIPYLWMTRMLRDALKADAPNRANADIWITEVGMPVGRKASETDAAKAVVKCYVMAIAQGVARIMWFEGRDPAGEQAGFGLLTRQGAERASYKSFKFMRGQLGQSPKYLGWLALGDQGRGYGLLFDGASGSVLVAWMPAGTTLDNDPGIRFKGDVQTIDGISGAKLAIKSGEALHVTDSPVFITDLPADQIATAKTNAGKNFPWGGDHSSAKTVSITLGQKSANKGIMQPGQLSTQTHEFSDGTTGQLIKDNKNAAFYIHPSFASIKTRDYYIRITLRRITEGNVGMNLAYEIADTKGQNGPMRNTGGWYSVAPDMNWQTHTWHVTDACFAKMWGYDINFKPEKSVPFVIGKVEVSVEPFEK